MRGLKGRVVAVTGGASGIGKATVQRFVEEGAKVAILDRNAEGAAAYASALTRQGHTAIGIAVNVANEGQVEAAFKEIEERFGSLGALVACAGVSLFGKDSYLDSIEKEVWNETMDINLTGIPDLQARNSLAPENRAGRFDRLHWFADRALWSCPANHGL